MRDVTLIPSVLKIVMLKVFMVIMVFSKVSESFVNILILPSGGVYMSRVCHQRG